MEIFFTTSFFVLAGVAAFALVLWLSRKSAWEKKVDPRSITPMEIEAAVLGVTREAQHPTLEKRDHAKALSDLICERFTWAHGVKPLFKARADFEDFLAKFPGDLSLLVDYVGAKKDHYKEVWERKSFTHPNPNAKKHFQVLVKLVRAYGAQGQNEAEQKHAEAMAHDGLQQEPGDDDAD
jgi:hypothetical protein